MTRALLGIYDDATGFLDVVRKHPLVAELARIQDTRLGVTGTTPCRSATCMRVTS